MTDEGVPVVAFGFNGGEGAHGFTATGTYSGDMMLTQRGTVASSAPVSGTLVIDGDSVGAYMTCERRSFRGSFAANDTLDSLIRYDVVRYRWYRRQERLPIALQCDITVSGVDGKEISEYSRVWLADLHREEMDEADRKARDRSRSVGLNGVDGDSGGYGRAGEVSAEEIAGAGMPLPEGRCYMPETVLERLVCYADCFYSKSRDMSRRSMERVETSMSRFGPGVLERFKELVREFGEVGAE